jgi:hypothetical protein
MLEMREKTHTPHELISQAYVVPIGPMQSVSQYHNRDYLHEARDKESQRQTEIQCTRVEMQRKVFVGILRFIIVHTCDSQKPQTFYWANHGLAVHDVRSLTVIFCSYNSIDWITA